MNPHKEATPKVVLGEGGNPLHDKGKRNVAYILGGELRCKMKVDPAIIKVALVAETKRKQRMQRVERRKREEKRRLEEEKKKQEEEEK